MPATVPTWNEFQALEARVTALEGSNPIPTPVDCVLGQEVLTSEQISPCVDGKQTVVRVYTKPIVTPPSNGGAECPPRVRTETIERDCSIATFPPVEPVTPLISFPEKRVYKSTQWHIDMHRDMNPNAMQHSHIEAYYPTIVKTGIVQIDIKSVYYHMQGCTHLGIRKIVPRVSGVQKWVKTYPGEKEPGRQKALIPEGEAGHLVNFIEPIVFDVSVVPFGNYRFEVDVDLLRLDGKVSHTRVHWNMWIDNDNVLEVDSTTRTAHAEGWESPREEDTVQTGYTIVHATFCPEYITDPAVPISIKLDGRPGHPAEFLVCKNPDLHQHPANYGEVIHRFNFTAFGVIRNEDGTQTEIGDKKFWKFQIPAITGLKVGDRIMMRMLHSDDAELGAIASLIVNTIRES